MRGVSTANLRRNIADKAKSAYGNRRSRRSDFGSIMTKENTVVLSDKHELKEIPGSRHTSDSLVTSSGGTYMSRNNRSIPSRGFERMLDEERAKGARVLVTSKVGIGGMSRSEARKLEERGMIAVSGDMVSGSTGRANVDEYLGFDKKGKKIRVMRGQEAADWIMRE